MLIVNAEVDGRSGIAVRIHDGHIVEVGAGLRPDADEVLDARGGAVIPGLHDHHVHLRSAVAARESVRLDPASVAAPGGLSDALQMAGGRLPANAWLRGIGAHGTEVEALDRWALDALVGDRPVRIQHRGGALWLLNSAGVRELDVASWTDEGVERMADGTPTGRLWRLDRRVDDAIARFRADQGPGLQLLSDEALRLGITGFTDATVARTHEDSDDLRAHADAGRIRQRLTLMADPRQNQGAAPFKIVLDDHDLPPLDELSATIAEVHAAGAPVAVHCVTAEQLIVALAAIESAGPTGGDRIEHGGIVPPGYAETMARLGITVVTQPGFLADRGDDYLRDVEESEQPWLYPCASLLNAGVAVGGSSDVPFGPLDPWLAMSTAVSRRTESGAAIGLDERVDAATALGLYLGRADAPGRKRKISPGEPGEICVLRNPLADVLSDLGAHQVAAVIIGDVLTFSDSSGQ